MDSLGNEYKIEQNVNSDYPDFMNRRDLMFHVLGCPDEVFVIA